MASSGPQVGILVGSDSDREAMEACTARLGELGVECEIEIRSIHESPESVTEYAGTAKDRGLKVLICASGMAAHLAGAVAGRTTLPVVGVPIATGALGGFDSLLSTVQMPPGVPVATVAVDGSTNAAMLAARILALSDDELSHTLEERK